MLEYAFDALGTRFSFLVDAPKVPDEVWQTIEERTRTFDQSFSRFLPDHPSNEVNIQKAGTFRVSKQLGFFLSFAQELKEKTRGAFDPAVAGLLDKAGYSHAYTFLPEKDLSSFEIPRWELHDDLLTVYGPTIFDIGAFGKGYWIDQLSEYLRAQGFTYHLVDGGGDMYGTEKKDGQPWQIAIEWPGRPELAVGELTLKYEGLAVSDIFKRSWGKNSDDEHWHHVVDATAKKPLQGVIGAAIVGKTAMIADGLSTALMVISESERSGLAAQYEVEYLIFTKDKRLVKSKQWQGTFYQ